MIGHRLGMFERAGAFQIVSNAGSPEGMIADLGLDARLHGAALDHAVGVRLSHALLRAGRHNVLVQKRFQLMVTRRFVFFAAFKVDPIVKTISWLLFANVRRV